MELSLLGRVAGMFAVTNVDDMLVFAVFFGQAAGHKAAAWRVVAGQYLGFLAILIASVVGALGARLLPEAVIPLPRPATRRARRPRRLEHLASPP